MLMGDDGKSSFFHANLKLLRSGSPTITAIRADVSITISMFTSNISIVDNCTIAVLFVKCQKVER